MTKPNLPKMDKNHTDMQRQCIVYSIHRRAKKYPKKC